MMTSTCIHIDMFVKNIAFVIIASFLVMLSACSKAERQLSGEGKTITKNAQLLHIADYGDYMMVNIDDPWNDGARLASYCLVPQGNKAPDTNAAIIYVPIQKALVYSSVHSGAFEELETNASIAGVADGQFFTSPFIKTGIASGRIVNVGNATSPSPELIASLNPDAVLLSPYQNSGHGVLDRFNLPVIEMADYMEPTPKGRAEWLLLIGALTGKLDRAQQIYKRVCNDYDSISMLAKSAKSHPKVIFDLPQSGVWAVPAGQSYASHLIADAGGINPWGDTKQTGSLQLDYSTVYATAHDADIWMLRTFGGVSPDDIAKANALNSKFKAFKDKKIYAADTRRVPLFDDVAFHPERLIADYFAVFSGDSTADMRYFKNIFN